MSWFTAAAKTTPLCPRCKKPGSCRLVKRSGEHDIHDCLRCGPIVPKGKS